MIWEKIVVQSRLGGSKNLEERWTSFMDIYERGPIRNSFKPAHL